ncbi:MAG: DUF3306 domain-containing protein [Polaromonas sp.]
MADSEKNAGNFLGRWSQRKVQARQAALPADEPSELVRPAAAVAQAPVGQPLAATESALPTEAPAKTAPPTLEDVAKLTGDSDYSAFAARHVDAKVRNAAMRKLFAGDPHFNVMDGLDVYIDDYSVGVPIPKSMMRQMVQARSLGLLDDELVDQDKPLLPELPTTPAADDNKFTHENTDLQLQRDDAAGHSGLADRAELFEEPHAARNPDHGADAPDHRPG